MRKDFGVKPWFYPLPILIIGTYDENGTPNAMNAACDYVGIVSGNNTPDKMQKAGQAFSDGKSLI